MAHINLPEQLPGIRGLMAFRPQTATPLNALAEVLLRSDEGLNKGERELIATYVSALNDCFFCQNIHGAVAAHYFDEELVKKIRANNIEVEISDKMKALLAIAGAVQQGGKFVRETQIEQAKNQGASDIEIHDTVLIAAAFCMFNRYVDSLNTFAPDAPEMYRERAKKIIEETGYAGSSPR
ncbi:carboxymuconolactone decarboxylase [Emticicia aquatilis]|uniref:Carboxymuconolactone decarboxylase n=1 Tax=Emticicia aquatilis TaxID=1537369 RepID=A0A916Z8C6_9BACT|nr:peroxidase-related enzyme [Emticicia aquatilis]GGD81294.1 carboxymuconolactone decarboxylase [Emticicia aquatilis]